MTSLNTTTISTYASIRSAVGRWWRDQRGASVSTVLLIAVLVVAIAAFGAIVAGQIGTAGSTVSGVNFGN